MIDKLIFSWRLLRRFTLNDEVDAGVVAAESVGGHAGEEGGIGTFQFADAQVGEHTGG